MSDLRVIELEQQLERRDAFITELEIEINSLKAEINRLMNGESN